MRFSPFMVSSFCLTSPSDTFGSSLATVFQVAASRRKQSVVNCSLGWCSFALWVTVSHTLDAHNFEGQSVFRDTILNCDGLIGNPLQHRSSFGRRVYWQVAFTALMWLSDHWEDPMSPQAPLHQGRPWCDHCWTSCNRLLVSYEIKEGLICPFYSTTLPTSSHWLVSSYCSVSMNPKIGRLRRRIPQGSERLES